MGNRAATGEDQCASAHGGAPGVGVRAIESGCASAEFLECAGACDRAGVGGGIRAVEDERRVVGDVSGDRAACAAVADGERAGGEGGVTAVGVGAGKAEGACPELGEVA